MTIEEVFDEYHDVSPDTYEEQERIAKQFRKDLEKAGMPKDEIEETVEVWMETTWTNEDWKKHYGVDSDEELDEAMDSDSVWSE